LQNYFGRSHRQRIGSRSSDIWVLAVELDVNRPASVGSTHNFAQKNRRVRGSRRRRRECDLELVRCTVAWPDATTSPRPTVFTQP